MDSLSESIRQNQTLHNIKSIIAANADPDGDGLWDVPLMEACKSKRVDITKLLISYGADPLAAIDDVCAFAIRSDIESFWFIVENSTNRFRHHAFSTLFRLQRVDEMITFVKRGFAQEMYLKLRPCWSVVPMWFELPIPVRECYLARQNSIDQMMKLGTSTRFMDIAAQNTLKRIRKIDILPITFMYPELAKDYMHWIDIANSPWQRNRHHLFGAAFRQTVLTIHLCAYSEKNRLFLPIEMWQYILMMLQRF